MGVLFDRSRLKRKKVKQSLNHSDWIRVLVRKNSFKA